MSTAAVTIETVKSKKDALVSALVSLSKAAQESSSATIDFFNVLSTVSSDANADGSLAQLASVLRNTADGLAPATDKPKKGRPKAAGKDEDATQAGADAESPVKTNKRKRGPPKVVDPDAPKKPLTMFFQYASHARSEIRQQREDAGLPALANNELTTEIARRWNNFNEEERGPWKKRYEDGLKTYNVEKELYTEKKKREDEAAGAGETAETTEASKSPVKATASAAAAADEVAATPKAKKSKKKDDREKKTEPEVAPSPSKKDAVDPVAAEKKDADKKDGGSPDKKEKKKEKKKKRKSGVNQE